ncbi:MAG: hypothetical protein U0996_02805 [Planctomycetaceae bacterium]
MNILNRNRNRRKGATGRLSTSADPCETRSLLCAAALPVAELIDTQSEVTDETSQSESPELVEGSVNEEIANLEICTFECVPVDVTAYSEDSTPVEGELSEEDLAKLTAGFYSMVSGMYPRDEEVVIPEFAEDFQPEIAVCYFGPATQLDENGNPIEISSEVEFDPGVYDITTLEGWDPSWAFRGVIVDGSEEAPSDFPVDDSGVYQPVDWSTEGFEDLDGDGVPDGLLWAIEDVGNSSETPVDGDPINLPIYWFGVADGGASEIDEFGNPIYYMTAGMPDDGELVDGEFSEGEPVDGEVKITLEDVVEFSDAETPVDGSVDGPVDENGEFIPVMYFSMGGPDMSAVQRNLDAVAESTAELPTSLPVIHHGPGGIPLVRIPVMRPQSSVFQGQNRTPATPNVSAQQSAVTSSPAVSSPVESMPATPATRLRSLASVRSLRPTSLPATSLNSLSPLLENEAQEEASEDVTVPPQVDDILPVAPAGESDQQTSWAPARERRSIDMFMSDFADDGYIG